MFPVKYQKIDLIYFAARNVSLADVTHWSCLQKLWPPQTPFCQSFCLLVKLSVVCGRIYPVHMQNRFATNRAFPASLCCTAKVPPQKFWNKVRKANVLGSFSELHCSLLTCLAAAPPTPMKSEVIQHVGKRPKNIPFVSLLVSCFLGRPQLTFRNRWLNCASLFFESEFLSVVEVCIKFPHVVNAHVF